VSLVHVTTVIAAPPERVWRLVMDPNRLAEWVTIHHELKSASDGPAHSGSTMEQVLTLRGVHFTVNWQLVECDPPHHATWEGKGPAHSRAVTRYELGARDSGTCFEYTNEFHAPGGMLGTVASRVLVGGISEREAQASLRRLKSLLESSTDN
jgi:uncharacterized protein YndB with AHSA1/START domain